MCIDRGFRDTGESIGKENEKQHGRDLDGLVVDCLYYGSRWGLGEFGILV